MQTTIKSPISFKGIGLHSGKQVRATIRPAPAEQGIWFRRTDVSTADSYVAARWDAVEQTERCTRVANADGVTVSTIEHIMAAIAGCGVHNAVIEIDGPELPILDGSAAPFVQGIVSRGLRKLGAPVRILRITDTVEVRQGDAFARLEPAEGFEIEFQIDFPDAVIGKQHKRLDMANGAFVRELCDCRTFGRLSDVEMLRANGLALGGSLDNALVVDGGRVLNPGGMRHKDEPVRHKMLDALGDIALAGAPILGLYTGYKAGHALSNKLLHALFATHGATRMEDVSDTLARRLPGMGVKPTDVPVLARAA
ncbi:UDP-3-O-acyl-N-acetylglucosamine deacetylase [Anianabacter salinae]|uniref:UDP-3-O-acyl-N-acetylglucosamine deacetylase n=1 Tax=Anianabacter salinae TaxID=2851023 RepID=UPI00225E56A8|nr:UDP-3-O-acyl-N-acetylglucosamine deacetylase [Anianabacter salinae]MBV0912867.1 UDP-3-O-acyl-N-acetylglucosamine deacetylase [Anianabacter salinae]